MKFDTPTFLEEDSIDIPSSGQIGEKVTELTLDQIEKIKEELVSYLRENRFLLNTFAEDTSLSYKIPGDHSSFAIDVDSGIIHVPLEWFIQHSYEKDQVLWACLHEITHFREVVDDKGGEEHNRIHLLAKAKEAAKLLEQKWVEKHGETHPDIIERITKQKEIPWMEGCSMNSLEEAMYEQYHSLHNVLRDVFVNNYVSRKAPAFDKESISGKKVESLYKEKLFTNIDLREKEGKPTPRHLQFIYKIMRDEMIPGESAIVTDEVQEYFNKKIRYKGRTYTVVDFINAFIKPRAGRDTSLTNRTNISAEFIEPFFDELLKLDIADTEIPDVPPEKEEQEQQKGGEGSPEDKGEGEKPEQKPEEGDPSKSQDDPKNIEEKGQENKGTPQKTEEPGQPTSPFEDFNKDMDSKQIDQFKPEDFNKLIKRVKAIEEAEEERKKAEEAERRKSAEQKKKELQDRLDKEFCEKHFLDPVTLEDFRRTQELTAPYREELSRLWDHIIYGSTKEITYGMEGHFTTGAQIDMRKVVKEFPQIEKGKVDDIRIYEKRTETMGAVEKPELIRVRLLCDNSLSMKKGGKVETLKSVMVLLLSSLAEFNNRLARMRKQTKSKTWVDTEVWKFGDETTCIKKLSGKEDRMDDVSTIKAFSYLKPSGSTDNTTVLNEINTSIIPVEASKIMKGKIMDIIFNITDGVPNDPKSTFDAYHALEEKGVIVRAFQIGGDAQEVELFNVIWNGEVGKGRGEVVGNNIGELVPAVVRTLRDYLSNVRI